MPRVRPRLSVYASTLVCGAFLLDNGIAADVEQTYMRNCAVCHLPGIAGAPKVGDKAEWARRLRAGTGMVYRNALEGIPNTAMTAKGGHTDLPDDEIRRVVDYMINAAALDAATLEAAARYDRRGIRDRDFVRLDANFDGYLSREELAGDAVLAGSLGRFDDDRDGRLDPAEWRKAEATLEAERVAVNVDDPSLVAAVRTALGSVSGVDLQSTTIEVEHGVVAMVGIVSTAEISRRAYAAIKRIPGIRKIDNRLVSGEQMGWD